MAAKYLGRLCTVFLVEDGQALIQYACGKQTKWIDASLITYLEGATTNGK